MHFVYTSLEPVWKLKLRELETLLEITKVDWDSNPDL